MAVEASIRLPPEVATRPLTLPDIVLPKPSERWHEYDEQTLFDNLPLLFKSIYLRLRQDLEANPHQNPQIHIPGSQYHLIEQFFDIAIRDWGKKKPDDITSLPTTSVRTSSTAR